MLPFAKKHLGQNFLVDLSVIDKILAAAEIKTGEMVLEIGPGTGVLTKGLLETGAKVTAVETDTDLLSGLMSFDKLDLINDDILAARKKDPSIGGRLEEGKYKLVANIPYNLTSNILEEFLSKSPRPSRLVLMLQKEVAERISAKPPDMSLLAVMCQLYAEVKIAAAVPRGAFRPIPKVDSAIVILNRFSKTDRTYNAEAIIGLAKLGFAAPRRQLHGNLQRAGLGSSETLKKTLESLGIRADARAEMLSAEQWVKLFEVLHKR